MHSGPGRSEIHEVSGFLFAAWNQVQRVKIDDFFFEMKMNSRLIFTWGRRRINGKKTKKNRHLLDDLLFQGPQVNLMAS